MSTAFLGIPRSIGWLATAWMLLATLAVLRIFTVSFDLGWGPVNIGIFGLLFGPGLMVGKSWVRRVLIGLTWLGILNEAIFAIGVVQWSRPQFWFGLCSLVVIVSLLLVQLHVLGRPEVRVFFR